MVKDNVMTFNSNGWITSQSDNANFICIWMLVQFLCLYHMENNILTLSIASCIQSNTSWWPTTLLWIAFSIVLINQSTTTLSPINGIASIGKLWFKHYAITCYNIVFNLGGMTSRYPYVLSKPVFWKHSQSKCP